MRHDKEQLYQWLNDYYGIERGDVTKPWLLSTLRVVVEQADALYTENTRLRAGVDR